MKRVDLNWILDTSARPGVRPGETVEMLRAGRRDGWAVVVPHSTWRAWRRRFGEAPPEVAAADIQAEQPRRGCCGGMRQAVVEFKASRP